MTDRLQSSKDNTQKLMDIVKEYVSIVVSDIYKIEGVEVKKMPGQRGTWIVSVEAVHSERNSSMAYFSFVFKADEIKDMLRQTQLISSFQRTGKE
jgi:hypothetical protein